LAAAIPGAKSHFFGDFREMGSSCIFFGTILIDGEQLDYLFVDGDHTYSGVQRDFELYSPLVRSGGIVAFHDIVTHGQESACQVPKFWNEVKHRYRHLEIIEQVDGGSFPVAITRAPMHTAGLGVLFMP
jgi:hypothetical protein